MSQLQTRIDDEQVLSLQLQKKIKELQVKVPGPSSSRTCLQALSRSSFLSLYAGLSFSSFSSLLQQHISFLNK
jgi:hypothetical protein